MFQKCRVLEQVLKICLNPFNGKKKLPKNPRAYRTHSITFYRLKLILIIVFLRFFLDFVFKHGLNPSNSCGRTNSPITLRTHNKYNSFNNATFPAISTVSKWTLNKVSIWHICKVERE